MRSSRLILPALLALADIRPASAFDYELMFAPPAQVTSSTCQSFALAVALSMLEPSNLPYTYEWRINDETELRTSEIAIRTRIEQEMRKDLHRDLTKYDDSTRPEWERAIGGLTFKQYKLQTKSFVSFEELLEYLKARVPIKLKVEAMASVLVPTPTTVYLTSFTRIEKNRYKGHIAVIFGIAEKRVNEFKFNSRPELFILNSFAKADDNECLLHKDRKQKYFGKAGWTDDYEIRHFVGSKPYVLNWIEKN